MTDREKYLHPLLSWGIISLLLSLILVVFGWRQDIHAFVVTGAACPIAVIAIYAVASVLKAQPIPRFSRSHKMLIAGTCACVALGTVYWWYLWTPLGDLVLAREYQGIIMRMGIDSGHPWSNAWNVARSDIGRLERDLSVQVHSHADAFGEFIPKHLSEYRRRYHGYEKEGRRFIACTLEHPEFTDRNTWLRHVYWTSGGGYLIWYITYDVESGSFTNFFTNAPK